MAGELRAPLITLDPLADGNSAIQAPLVTLDPLSDGDAAIRASLLTADPLTEGAPAIRVSFVSVDALSEAFRNLRVALICIESLIPVEPEGTVSTELFPGTTGSGVSLPGLAFDVGKKPGFSTGKHVASSGVSVRVGYQQYPIWIFEFNYEFISDDRSAGVSSLESLMGFFMSRGGGFDTFLYKDTQNNDYAVVNGALGTADGVTTQFSFKRTMGGFAEKIGQIDQGQTITLYGSLLEARTIPANPGPYTITATHAADFVEDLGVTKSGVAMVKVASAPATGQYAVNIATGVYTFAAADHDAAVVLHYRYKLAPADYTITLPNLVVFTSAPASGLLISADFQFFFNCCFQEDAADFRRFADKLWNLNSLTIETVPQ